MLKLPGYYGNTKPVYAVLKSFFFGEVQLRKNEYLCGVPKCHYVFLVIKTMGFLPSTKGLDYAYETKLAWGLR
jgi:hypothetical protein